MFIELNGGASGESIVPDYENKNSRGEILSIEKELKTS